MTKALNTQLLNDLKTMTSSLRIEHFIGNLFDKYARDSSSLLVEIWTTYTEENIDDFCKNIQCLLSKSQIIGALLVSELCKAILNKLETATKLEIETMLKELPGAIDTTLNQAQSLAELY